MEAKNVVAIFPFIVKEMLRKMFSVVCGLSDDAILKYKCKSRTWDIIGGCHEKFFRELTCS